jgi:hypothetical protein
MCIEPAKCCEIIVTTINQVAAEEKLIPLRAKRDGFEQGLQCAKAALDITNHPSSH